MPRKIVIFSRGWPLYIWVYEDLNPKMEKILDFLGFFFFIFSRFLNFLDFFGLFVKKFGFFPVFLDFGLFFVRNFWIFLDFFRNFWIFGIDFLGCTKTFLSEQPLGCINRNLNLENNKKVMEVKIEWLQIGNKTAYVFLV